MPDQRVFYERFMAQLKETVHELGGDMPELEAVMVVPLWKLPDQTNVPGAMLIGAREIVTTPDQMMRCLQAVTHQLMPLLVTRSMESVNMLRRTAEEYGRSINGRTEPRGPQAQQAPTTHGNP